MGLLGEVERHHLASPIRGGAEGGGVYAMRRVCVVYRSKPPFSSPLIGGIGL